MSPLHSARPAPARLAGAGAGRARWRRLMRGSRRRPQGACAATPAASRPCARAASRRRRGRRRRGGRRGRSAWPSRCCSMTAAQRRVPPSSRGAGGLGAKERHLAGRADLEICGKKGGAEQASRPLLAITLARSLRPAIPLEASAASFQATSADRVTMSRRSARAVLLRAWQTATEAAANSPRSACRNESAHTSDLAF